MFWDSIIRFVLESYLEVAISAQINVSTDFFATEDTDQFESEPPSIHERVSFYLAVIWYAAVLIAPLASGIFLCRRKHLIAAERQVEHKLAFQYKKVADDEKDEVIPYTNRYGQLFEGAKADRHSTILVNVIFMLRRLAFAAVLVYLPLYPWLQIQLSLGLTFAYLMYVAMAQPFMSRAQNRLETFNDFLNLCVGYHFFLFTDFVPDMEMRYACGWSAIGLICLALVANMGVMAVDSVRLALAKRAMKRRKERFAKQKQFLDDLYEEAKKREEAELKGDGFGPLSKNRRSNAQMEKRI